MKEREIKWRRDHLLHHLPIVLSNMREREERERKRERKKKRKRKKEKEKEREEEEKKMARVCCHKISIQGVIVLCEANLKSFTRGNGKEERKEIDRKEQL